jgi:hypothetical protein
VHLLTTAVGTQRRSLRRTQVGRKRRTADTIARLAMMPPMAYQRQEALQRVAAGETQTDIARSYGVSHVTIGRVQGPVLRPFDGAR